MSKGWTKWRIFVHLVKEHGVLPLRYHFNFMLSLHVDLMMGEVDCLDRCVKL